MVTGEEFSCSSHTSLYLVRDDQNVLWRAELVDRVNELFAQYIDTAFALKVSVFSSPIQLPAETTIAGSPSA